MQWGAASDVGRRRRNNEDAWGAFPEAGAWCVADGMGGAEGGETASRAVVSELGAALRRWGALVPPLSLPDRAELFARAADAASAWIFDWAARNGAPGAGTTLAAVLLDPARPGRPLALHAGDSRLYRLRGRRLSRITEDHSVAGLAGVRDESELPPGFRNLVTRAVGVRPRVELEKTPFRLAPSDRLLLCSDGLYRMVSDGGIAEVLHAAATPEEAAAALVARANDAGGEDNVTALVLFAPERFGRPASVRPRLGAAGLDALAAAAGTDEDETEDTRPTAQTEPAAAGATERKGP
ncbi:MAG: serine/threonine-protein phosphatase [Kiritimatiellae bacterium]|nr:serine/threonine-protein phosphatase [Kiritimatiellia bacterium]